MAFGNYLRKLFPDITVTPLEPAESPTLSTGFKVGSHRIQGISDEFIPQIVDLKQLDPILRVHDGDAIRMAQALGRTLGLAVGISSGANLVGAIRQQRTLGTARPLITIFPDSNKKYLSTDLVKEEPVEPYYLTPKIILKSYRAIPV